MSEAYWQAKIWGLLHDPALKALHNNSGRGDNSFWLDLPVMAKWKENDWNPETKSGTILKRLKLADYITSASDRGAIGSLCASVDYRESGLEISHLLSGEKQHLKLKQNDHSELLRDRKQFLQGKENQLRQQIPDICHQSAEATFWWLWRCLPEATCNLFDDASLLLMPGETRLPDSSIWSHASLTAAMAGALGGYDLTEEAIKQKPHNYELSHPYLVNFSFTPIQELIKASRKMRDFWAGSWLLHYLSAKVSYKLAFKYGPDCLLYPSLFQQPLIDHWLLQRYPDFKPWVTTPSDRALLTAGFPNVIIAILPKAKVAAAMQMAKATLLEEWRNIAHLVLENLQNERHWMRQLQENDKTWRGWLDAQWQTYWSAIPIGAENQELSSSEIYREDEAQNWLKAQNQAYNLSGNKAIFLQQELEFLRKAAEIRQEEQKRKPFNANVGSWWAGIFDQTRLALSCVKNARNWELPTVFGNRSTISGLGSVVYPDSEKKREDWVTEGETRELWKRNAGLFDGIEELNATETVKRGLEKVLPQLLQPQSTTLDNSEDIKEKIKAYYPDLTVGVAGYLKTGTTQDLEHFQQACSNILKQVQSDHNLIPDALTQKWGLPWIDDHNNPEYRRYHPRFLNAGWLVEEIEEDETKEYREILQATINQYYPSNNPADWYVLAAGDGDGMSEWLKGSKMKPYQDYIPSDLEISAKIEPEFAKFLEQNKRMGPSTHNALSRALLDFSNQLVPYLTENRYAGRLIYGGGDDVLAYTNLWEWDQWLWDIRQCFRGETDDKHQEFENKGDYWRWVKGDIPTNREGKPILANRPLFTMGKKATISFGIIIAHHSVPLAIALENLWEAEKKAKDHYYHNQEGKKQQKDALQVRVLYGNGNSLESTAKFDIFAQWQQLLTIADLESSLFESAATLWSQHPAPTIEAISSWVKAFTSRREKLTEANQQDFESKLTQFLENLWLTTLPHQLDQEVSNWLKLAAFVLRNRTIKIREL